MQDDEDDGRLTWIIEMKMIGYNDRCDEKEYYFYYISCVITFKCNQFELLIYKKKQCN